MWGGYENLSQVGVTIEEIGYGVLSGYTGKGIGTAIVSRGAKMCKSALLTAWVSEQNRASERCFEKNGFQKLSLNEERHLSAFSDAHNFYCWIKEIR